MMLILFSVLISVVLSWQARASIENENIAHLNLRSFSSTSKHDEKHDHDLAPTSFVFKIPASAITLHYVDGENSQDFEYANAHITDDKIARIADFIYTGNCFRTLCNWQVSFIATDPMSTSIVFAGVDKQIPNGLGFAHQGVFFLGDFHSGNLRG